MTLADAETDPANPLFAQPLDKYHGLSSAFFPLEKEKPWHRAAAMMFAAGAVTGKEVAFAFGVSEATISNLIRQKWFQDKVNTLMMENGGRDIMQLFKAEAFNSLVTLVELRDSAKVGPAVRATCAKDLLDRALGKPIQRVEQSNIPTSSDPVAEVQRLEEANNRLRVSSLPQ